MMQPPQPQQSAERRGVKVVVEEAVGATLAKAATERRPNPNAIGHVRSNSYALGTRDTTYALPDFFPAGSVAWPEQLLSLWRAMRFSSLTGAFAAVSRAWFTVDNQLVLWDYRGGRQFCVYDEIPELISVVGAPLRPADGVFQPHVTYVLPVATTSMVFLLGLCVVGDEERAEMKVVNLGYSCTTETVVTKIVGSNGRVFCAGANGNVCEVRYKRENTALIPKMRLVSYGHWFSATPVIGQLSSTVANVWGSWVGGASDGLIDLVVDEPNCVVAALSERSTISLWRLHPNGGLRYMLSLRHRPDRQARSQAAANGESSPLTRLFVIDADAQGCRLMAVAANGDQFRYRYVNPFDTASDAELVLESYTPSPHSSNKEITVCCASASAFIAAFGDANDDRASDEVLAATSPAALMPPHQGARDVVTVFSGAASRIVRVDAIECVPAQQARGISDVCAQVCYAAPAYIVVHRHGLSLYVQARPVDTLYLILACSRGDCREGLLARFASTFSTPDYAAMLLQIAAGALHVAPLSPLCAAQDSSVLSSTGGSGGNDDGAPLIELGQQLLSGDSAEAARRAREVLRGLQLPSTQAVPASVVGDMEVQSVVVLMSPLALGLVTYLGRALSPLWDVPLSKCVPSSVSTVASVLWKLTQYLDSISIGSLPEQQRTLDLHQEWQLDKVVVVVPRGRSLRAEDLTRLQNAMLHATYDVASRAWQAATLLRRTVGTPLHPEDASVTFAQVVRDPAAAQRLGSRLSGVMLSSQQGVAAGGASRGTSFAQLQQQCPHFFGGVNTRAYQLRSDMDAMTRRGPLQSLTDVEVQLWAAEVGPKAASYWATGALQSICEQLRSMKREKVAVELLLHAAAQLDPSNTAMNLFSAKGGAAGGEQDRHSSSLSLRHSKTQALELVVSTLESAWLTHRSVVDDLLGGPRQSGTIWQVEPADEYAHCFLFDWLCAPRGDSAMAKTLRDTLVAAQSPFVAGYLRRNAEGLTEEYAHYLANVHGDYEGAVQQCCVMAQAPLSDMPVAERLPYRLRCLRGALDCARRCQSDQTQEVQRQLRLLEAQQRLYRVITDFLGSGSASLDRRVECEGQIMTERDVAVQHIEFLSSFVASVSNLLEIGGMYTALGGAEVQLDALACANVTDPAVYATCVRSAYEKTQDTAAAITKRLIDHHYHTVSCFPLSYLVQLLESRMFSRSPAGSPEVVQLLVGLGVDPKVLLLAYESILNGCPDDGVACAELAEAGVSRGYLAYSYATVTLCLAERAQRGSVQLWLVTNAMAATQSMIRRVAVAVATPDEQAAIEGAEELLRKANTMAAHSVAL